jgi:hypothetical protein
MYKIIGLSAIAILVLLSNTASADDSKWCATIQAIYGVCSPELVSNYLAHVNIVSIPRVVVKPPKDTSIVSSIPPNKLDIQDKPIEALKPNQRYWTSPSGHVYIQEYDMFQGYWKNKGELRYAK